MAEQILGNENLMASLRRIASSGRIANGYILNGPEGSGKKLIAARFAEMIGASPADTVFTEHEKPNLISVDDVRAVNAGIHIRPYDSPYRVYIVDEAEKMNVQAQNALLKTIEEPPSYVVILLLTTNAEAFLETILSRCVLLNVQPLPVSLAEEWLVGKGFSESEARTAAVLSGGALGRAQDMLNSESFREMLGAVTDMLSKARNLSTRDLLAFTSEMAKFKGEQQEALDFIRTWFRDVLLYKTENDTRNLIFRMHIGAVKDMSPNITFEGIERVLREVERAGTRIAANVNPELTFELLALRIREELK